MQHSCLELEEKRRVEGTSCLEYEERRRFLGPGCREVA